MFSFKLIIAEYAALIKVCFVLSLIADCAALMVCFVYFDMEILNVP